MLKTNKKVLDFCKATMHVVSCYKIKNYLFKEEYNKVRFLVAEELQRFNKPLNKLDTIKHSMLNQVEDYLINKIEEEYDRNRI